MGQELFLAGADGAAKHAYCSSLRNRRRSGKTKAVIQQNALSHYREPLFKLLGADPRISYTIVGGREPDTPHLRVIDKPEEKFRFIPAQLIQIRLGPNLTLFWQPEAIRACLREAPDTIIALSNPYSLTAWALLTLGRIVGIPVLLWGHGLLAPESGPKWWIRKVFYRMAAGHLLYGNYAKELLIRRGFSSEKLFVVYNSLDYDAQRALAESISHDDIVRFRASLGLAPEEKLVAYTGRLQKEKRLDMLLEAAAWLRNIGRELHVVLVGTGSEVESLARLARSLGLEGRVHFQGECYKEAFLALVFKAAHACVIPAGAGLAIMHAMVYGAPVILHDDVSGHGPEWEAVQEGVTGFFYRAGDSRHLAEKIEQVVYGEVDLHRHEACQEVIRSKYNPHVQAGILADAVKRTVAQRDRI